jgi:hypothetical protein
MDTSTLTDFKNFINNSKQGLFGIYFSENYHGYSAGLAIETDNDYVWIEDTVEEHQNLNEQYGFDSQGYGESICIVELSSDTNLSTITAVAENMDSFYSLPQRLYNKKDALDFLNTFEDDTSFIVFVERAFKNFVFDTELKLRSQEV